MRRLAERPQNLSLAFKEFSNPKALKRIALYSVATGLASTLAIATKLLRGINQTTRRSKLRTIITSPCRFCFVYICLIRLAISNCAYCCFQNLCSLLCTRSLNSLFNTLVVKIPKITGTSDTSFALETPLQLHYKRNHNEK